MYACSCMKFQFSLVLSTAFHFRITQNTFVPDNFSFVYQHIDPTTSEGQGWPLPTAHSLPKVALLLETSSLTLTPSTCNEILYISGPMLSTACPVYPTFVTFWNDNLTWSATKPATTISDASPSVHNTSPTFKLSSSPCQHPTTCLACASWPAPKSHCKIGRSSISRCAWEYEMCEWCSCRVLLAIFVRFVTLGLLFLKWNRSAEYKASQQSADTILSWRGPLEDRCHRLTFRWAQCW